MPSPVAPAGLDVVPNAWPSPPAAITTACAEITPGVSRPSAPMKAAVRPPTVSPATERAGTGCRVCGPTGSALAAAVPVQARAPAPVPAPSVPRSRSSATVRSRISIRPASRAASSVRCTSAPVASSPECTIRRALCPPSSRRSRVSSRAPSPVSQSIAPGAPSASAATTSGSHSPAPAMSVSDTCAAGVSPAPSAAASPPCASGVAPPTRSLVTTRTRSPRAAAVSATEIPPHRIRPRPRPRPAASRS